MSESLSDLKKFDLLEEPKDEDFKNELVRGGFYEFVSDSLLKDGEPDHEIGMSISQLKKISYQAGYLANMLEKLGQEEQIMAWAQDKISKSEHFIEAF